MRPLGAETARTAAAAAVDGHAAAALLLLAQKRMQPHLAPVVYLMVCVEMLCEACLAVCVEFWGGEQ